MRKVRQELKFNFSRPIDLFVASAILMALFYSKELSERAANSCQNGHTIKVGPNVNPAIQTIYPAIHNHRRWDKHPALWTTTSSKNHDIGTALYELSHADVLYLDSLSPCSISQELFYNSLSSTVSQFLCPTTAGFLKIFELCLFV